MSPQNVLITGVSGGIGRAVAEELLSSGASVTGIARDVEEIQERFAGRFDGRANFVSFDLMKTEELETLLKEIISRFGPIGGFVHCAGFDKMRPLSLARIPEMEALWKIHALVPMYIISRISRKNNFADGMSIVLITSQSAHEGAMGHSVYASAKGAVEGYLAPAAAELMEKGIRINEVCLAPVRTKMASDWMDKLDPERKQRLLDSYPLGFGEAQDAAGLICFLLSDKARFINGQIITADGGHSVRKV